MTSPVTSVAHSDSYAAADRPVVLCVPTVFVYPRTRRCPLAFSHSSGATFVLVAALSRYPSPAAASNLTMAPQLLVFPPATLGVCLPCGSSENRHASWPGSESKVFQVFARVIFSLFGTRTCSSASSFTRSGFHHPPWERRHSFA